MEKQTDKIFAAKAKNLRVEANDNAWSRIATRLDSRKKRVPILNIWPIAAGFLLLLAFSLYLFVDSQIRAGSSYSSEVIRTYDVDLEAYSSTYYEALEEWIHVAEKYDYRVSGNRLNSLGNLN